MNYDTRVITAQGLTGSVEFDGNTIIIKKNAVGDKFIPIKQLTALHLHPKTFLGGNAYIEFSHAGAMEHRHKVTGGLSQMMDQVRNENMILFNKKQQPQFIALRDAILEALRRG